MGSWPEATAVDFGAHAEQSLDFPRAMAIEVSSVRLLDRVSDVFFGTGANRQDAKHACVVGVGAADLARKRCTGVLR